MGRQDPSLVYTDLLETAAWRTRPAPDPWSERPRLSLLDGFSLRMVSTDWMHTWHLGVARDLVGACDENLLEVAVLAWSQLAAAAQ